MPNTRTKTEVQLTRKLVVKAADIRKMDEEAVLQLVGQLLDVAQDAGGKVGPQNNLNPYYYYRWQNQNNGPGAVRPRRLRQASGGSLREGDRRRPRAGRAAGAAEQGRARADRRGPRGRRARRPDVTIADDEVAAQAAGDAKFQEIPVRVELLVRFEVHSKSDKKRARRPP